MPTGVARSPASLTGLAIVVLVGCQGALRTPSASAESSAPPATSQAAEPSAASSVGPEATLPPPNFTISWSQMPWTGRVNAVTYDTDLGLWMAFGWEEMWTSPDGAVWERHAVAGEELGHEDINGNPPYDPTGMLDATRRADRIWSAGWWQGYGDDVGLVMWTSTDGLNWEIVPQVEPRGGGCRGIASNGLILAVACHYFGLGDGAVYTSLDGQHWTLRQSAGTAGMLDVYGDDDGFVAVGYRFVDSAHYEPTIWTSPDGITWTDVSPESASGELQRVVRTPAGTYVAVAVRQEDSVAVWRSDDRLHWEQVEIAAPHAAPGAFLPLGLASADAVILVVNAAEGLSVWGSIDGRSWAEVKLITGGPRPQSGTVLAIHGNRVILFAGESSEFWIGDIGPTG